MTSWTVGQVADLVGVTVRTLHHYDEIGLLVPSERSRAGYRLYTEADLSRLQQVVVYRRLELPLDQIATLVGGDEDAATHLRRQRDVVIRRLDELHELVSAIDRALERTMDDRPATPEALTELFGDGFDDGYEQEAQERWGETKQWEQSRTRTASYTAADWQAVKAEMDTVNAAFIAALASGEPATSAAAMHAAEQHRRHIDERFYAVSYDLHRALADMYVADPRFMKSYEDLAPGLAAFVHDAIHANADGHA